MPFGVHPNHENIATGELIWFKELMDNWNAMPIVSLSNIRKQAFKRSILSSGYWVNPDDVVDQFKGLRENKHQTGFRQMIVNRFKAFGLNESEHFHISFIELDPGDYRVPNTNRLCYIWKCASKGFALDKANFTVPTAT